MVGLRGDLFVVGPASSFHHNQHQHDPIHHHHHHHHHSSDPVNNNSNTALGVGVIPLLSASPCNLGLEDAGDHHSNNNSNSNFNGNNRSTNRGLSSGIQLWQNHPSYSLKKSIMFDQNNSLLNPGGGGVLGAGATGTTSTSNTTSSTATCQDCGNQAKKDCSHRRCRTCCKSRGYDCSTHVKSTWVPAARRRERQLSSAAAAAAAAAGSSGSTSGVKKPRLITSQTTTSHTSTSNSFDTSSSHQDASFREALPGQVRAPAVFKCVRVTAIEDGEDEYAYQAVVKIGGHVFKGFLYDQGVDGREGFPNISELHLGASSGGPSVGGGGRNGASSSPIMDPSDVYAASSGGGLLGGTAFGNPIN